MLRYLTTVDNKLPCSVRIIYIPKPKFVVNDKTARLSTSGVFMLLDQGLNLVHISILQTHISNIYTYKLAKTRIERPHFCIPKLFY